MYAEILCNLLKVLSTLRNKNDCVFKIICFLGSGKYE